MYANQAMFEDSPAISTQTMPRKLAWAKETTAAATARTQTARAYRASRREERAAAGSGPGVVVSGAGVLEDMLPIVPERVRCR